jgi:hypothetical protein
VRDERKNPCEGRFEPVLFLFIAKLKPFSYYAVLLSHDWRHVLSKNFKLSSVARFPLESDFGRDGGG